MIRDIDHELGITESITSGMFDSRDPERIRYTLIELLRERLYAMSVGFSNQDDLDRLAHDPAFRMAVWDRPGDKVLDERLASQPTQSRLVNLLAWDKRNLNRLREGLSESVTRHVQANGKGHAVMRGTIDIDSFPIEVHGQQEGGNYNGYYRKTTYHPLVASFCVAGDYDSGREGHRLGNGFIHADRLGEFNQAIGVHLSSQPFAKNEATMLLAMLAYNLASIARNELEDAVGGCWDLRRFQTYVLQAGARITQHARRLIVHVAQSVEDFWMQLRDCISRWKLPDRFRPPRGPRPRAWRPPPAHAHRQEVLRS